MNSELKPEEVLLLAQAALSPGAPVKVRSYVKRSTTGKQVIVRQAIRGAAGGTGRTPILPAAQTTPVISDKALQAEAAAARAGVAVQRAAQAAAQKQAAAALKAQKQQQAAKNKKQKTTGTTAKAPATSNPKTPKLGRVGALGALRGVHGHGLYALRGRPGRLFPGSRALGNAMARARRARGSTGKSASQRSSSLPRILSPVSEAERRASSLSSQTAAHRALEAAAAYRREHAHGHHSVGLGFHEKLAGEIIKHEAKRLNSHLHLSQGNVQDDAIIMAQEALRIEGYPVEVTGLMNDETANALADFLSKEGIDIDASFE